MTIETKTKQIAAQAKAPAQNLVHGLFGRRVSEPKTSSSTPAVSPQHVEQAA